MLKKKGLIRLTYLHKYSIPDIIIPRNCNNRKSSLKCPRVHNLFHSNVTSKYAIHVRLGC